MRRIVRLGASLMGALVVGALTIGATSDVEGAGRRSAPRPLIIERVHGGDRFVLTPESADGGFDEADLAAARRAFAWRVNGATHAVEPRLLDRVYRTMRHFEVDHVQIVSGYREDRWTSRHTHGRAMDMRLPGVPTARLARHLRKLGFAGVGFYPRGRFVHLDVRRHSAFWVDYSRPGRRGRPRTILRGQAMRADEQAIARGEVPFRPLPPAPDAGAVDRATILARTAPGASHHR